MTKINIASIVAGTFLFVHGLTGTYMNGFAAHENPAKYNSSEIVITRDEPVKYYLKEPLNKLEWILGALILAYGVAKVIDGLDDKHIRRSSENKQEAEQ